MTISIFGFVSLVALGAWIYLVWGRANFWKADQWLGPVPAKGPARPGVVAVVPARNEGETIARTVKSLAAQAYDGPFAIIVVDDASSDGTGDLARNAFEQSGAEHRFAVVEAPPLEPGWTGKLAAMQAGVDAAAKLAPDAAFVWFTDADIVHGPKTLERLIAKTHEGNDLVSLMVRLHCRSFWERLLIPAFLFFFQMLYPFPAINARPPQIGGAAGGCLLVSLRALGSIDGLNAIKGALIDDCTLAEAVRHKGFYLWLGHADDSRSLRRYENLAEIWNMVARTAYTQLDYSPAKLAGTVLGMALVFLVGPLAVLLAPWHGSALALLCGLGVVALMIKAYAPTLRIYAKGPLAALTLPAAAALYTAMTADSARRHWQGEGGAWKARTYDFG